MNNIPLKKNHYTDGGYRFIYNQFDRQDDWSTLSGKKKLWFYMVGFYNHDIYQTKDSSNNSGDIAKYYFRLETEKIIHNRILYGLMDWCSDIGGVSKSIMFTLIAIFGGASFFSSRVEMMLHLYSDMGIFKFFEGHNLEIVKDDHHHHHHEGGQPTGTLQDNDKPDEEAHEEEPSDEILIDFTGI